MTDGVMSVGAGSYTAARPAGHEGPPETIYRTANVNGPMPTSRWWSSAAAEPYSHGLYPHPLALQATRRGLGVDYPDITIGEDGYFGAPSILGTYRGDLTLGSTAGDFPETRVDDYSDWTVSLLWDNGQGSMHVTAGHGSPYLYATFAGGDPLISCHAPPHVWHGDATSPALGITINGHHYALFGPGGSTWAGLGTDTLTNNLAGRGYCSLAVLPEATPAALELFARHAHAHVVGSRVAWAYDREHSLVHTVYDVTTQAVEGEQTGTILALYPHQWKALSAPAPHSLLPYTYHTPRGTMKTLIGVSFATTLPYRGILPIMPDLDTGDEATIRRLVGEVRDEGDHNLYNLMPNAERDMYWTGVSLGRIATLIPIARQVGAMDAAHDFLGWLKETIEAHFTATTDGTAKSTALYYYDATWGALIGYPGGFGAHTVLNDHHYQYAYWIRAAVEIGRHDTEWIRDDRWGGMVDLLVRDIATMNRDDAWFPFLRHFDVYAGHSWATGMNEFDDGANAESLSEAIAAWTALILWGELTGDVRLRDLGIYGYATETHAVDQYWFDVDGDTFPPDFPHNMVGQVWGGKSSYITWWTDNAEAIRGISMLPLTPASLYLGRDPDYVRANLRQLREQEGSGAWSYWPDILWEYQAFADPADALALYEDNPSYVSGHGESRAHTAHWLRTMVALGHVNRAIAADTPLYAVFDKGGERTYVAYNMGATPIDVTFSDGATLRVPARRVATKRRA